jgi:hypothetical protein
VVLFGAPALQEIAVLEVAAVLHAARRAVSSQCNLAGVEIVVEGVRLHVASYWYLHGMLSPSIVIRIKMAEYIIIKELSDNTISVRPLQDKLIVVNKDGPAPPSPSSITPQK